MEESEAHTMRQEQKPGLLSNWESAASAGLRMLSSRLIELASSVYIAVKSEAESAIAVVNQRLLYTQSGTSKEKYTWTELVSWIGRVFWLMWMIFFFALCVIRDYMNLEVLLLCESLLWLRFTWRNIRKKKMKWNRRWSLLQVLSANYLYMVVFLH